MKAFLSSNSLPSLACACVSAALCLGLAPSASADAVNLGGAADYAVLGEGGTVSIESDFKVYQSGTVVNGNVGMGPYSLLQHGIDATINGRFDYDTTSSLNAQAITVPPSGGVHQID